MQPATSMTTAAKIITNLFSPITATATAMIILYAKYIPTEAVPARHVWLWMSFCCLFLTIGILAIFMKIGLISNWDITDRSQRPRFLAVVSFILVLIVGITWILGFSEALAVLLFFVVMFSLASVITLFWKISFHTFSTTLCILFITFTYENPYLYILLLIPIIVAWTRVYLKKHTRKQVAGGMILALISSLVWVAAQTFV